jgi:hypothetical protein
VKVVVIPVHVTAGSEVRVPDVTPTQIEIDRRALMKLFPITGAEVSVHEPVTTSAMEMVDVLDEVAALRDAESAAPDVAYYGVVSLAPTLSDYCSPNCVLGASFNGENGIAGVGVGIGFSGDQQARTFVHELGHAYGRVHTPCGVSGDPNYPYSQGRIGSWGYDILDGGLIDPNSYSDFMGYCAPVWISDYVFAGLQDFIGGANQTARRVHASSAPTPSRFQTLIVEPRREQRWGRSRAVPRKPGGTAEQAAVLDGVGRVLKNVDVYRVQVADLDTEMVYVPLPEANWESIRIAGVGRIAFAHVLGSNQR